jgi:pimeloyl-ACP methyl ester carboxylesterase
MRKLPILALLIAAVLLAGCSSDSDDQAVSRAVVIMSGGAAVSPFTTPTQACSSEEGFLSAGNTDTALRDFLLAEGKQVYTAPAMAPWGPVAEPDPTSFGPFKDCPVVLPESMTVMSAGDIDAAGEKLARFVNYLHTEYGVTDVDFVGHSNGGLFSRAATRILKQTDAPVTVRSITMLGTPNDGSVPGSYTWGEFQKADCRGVVFCETFNENWLEYAAQNDLGLNREDTFKYLDGQSGWNNAQEGYLDGIPVTLLGGAAFTADGGNPTMWPNDGITSRYSAWASGVPDAVIPWRACWVGPLTHSIFVTDAYNQTVGVNPPWDRQTALTWNSDALARVNRAIDESDSALQNPNREGCS